MPRPIEAVVHRRALAHNLARARAAARDAKVWAVVKADAYGHGIERVYDALRGADGYALLDIAEAERLRALGWRGPILLLEGAFDPRDLEACSRLDLQHVVHCAEQVGWLAAHKTLSPQRVWVKVNSGMNRLGFAPVAARRAYARLAALPQVADVGVMTHFADADAADAASLDAQVAAFDAATHDLGGERSVSNSAALLRHPRLRNDWVRAGILLYGSAPDHPQHTSADWDLHPAMTLRSRIIATQSLAAGDAVGYGSTWRAPAATRIGIVACGYADGYPRHAASGTPVLIDGAATTTVGRVSMDMLAVDLGALPSAGVGSEVTLWGRGPGDAVLPIDTVAHAAVTIAYELMCALARRVPVTTSE